MARQRKSIAQLEQGYSHREHRSKGGRKEDLRYKKFVSKKIKRLKNKPERGQRKGKWIT